MKDNNIRICICEDNSIHRDLLNGYICKFFNVLDYDILEFTSGEELLSKYPDDIDLLFLDIQMQDLNGMDTARRIREFSNALDNAIEACDKILDESMVKYISVNVTYINSFCFIKIENSKVNDIKVKNNNFITSKKEKSMHGIGLKNIKDTVYKYNGEISIDFDNDKFLIKIIFPLKN